MLINSRVCVASSHVCNCKCLKIMCCYSQHPKCAGSLPTRTGFCSTKLMGELMSLVQCPTLNASTCPSVMTCSLPCSDRNQLDVLDVLEGQVHTITLPINVKAVFLVAEDRWLLIESKTDRCPLSPSSYRNMQKMMCNILLLLCASL